MNILVPDKPELYFLIIAGSAGVTGIVLWADAVRWARALLTLLLAEVGADIGWLAPYLWHWNLSPITTMICGVAAGIFLGALLFRPIQALLLAGFLALLSAGSLACDYGAFHSPPEFKPAATAHADSVVGIKSLAAEVSVLPPVESSIKSICGYTQNQMEQLTAIQRSEVYALGVGVFLIVLLLGLLFVHVASMVGGAWLGAIFMVWSGCIFLQYFRPSAFTWVIQHNLTTWAMIVLAVSGMAIQSHTILEKQKKSDDKKKKKSAKKSEDKA